MADGSVKIEVLLDDSKVSGGVKKVEGRLSGIASTAKRGIATVGKLAGALGLVGLAYKGIDMVKNSLDGAIDRYDTLNNFPRVMKVLGFDAEESEVAINKLSDGIQGLPTRLDEVASTAQNIAVMTGDLDGAVDTTLALNNAFLASGASVADASRGMEVYQNMLATGEVDGQRWKTLQETMGVALSMVAEKAGFEGPDALNKLYDSLKDGTITFDEFNDMLIEANNQQDGLADLAKENTDGLGTAWMNLEAWIIDGLAKVIKAIDLAMGGVGSVSGAINRLKPIVQGVFGWIANTAIPAVASGVQWVREKFDELKPVFDKVKGALEPLFEVFKQTGENLSNQLSPILEKLMQIFSSLWPIIEKIAVIVGGALVASIIIATTVLNGLLNAIGPLIEAFLSLVDVVINVVNSIVALLTGDFQGALDYWNDATESAVEFFKNLWDGIVGFVEGIVDAVVGWFQSLYDTLVGNSIIPDMVNAIIEWFGSLFTRAIEIVTNLVNDVIAFFTEMKDKAIEKATQLYDNVRDKFQQVKQAIIDRIRQAKDDLIRRFTEMVTNAKNKATEIVNTARQKFEEVKQRIREKLTEAVRVVGEKIGEMPGKVIEFASDMVSAGKDLVQGLIDGIKDMSASAIEAVTGVVNGVIDKAKSLLKISSPSKLFEQYGKWTGEGLAKGIESMQKVAEKASEKLGLGVEDALSSQLQIDSLRALKGYTPNAVLAGYIPNTVQVTQQLIESTKYRQQQPVIKIQAGDVIMDGRKVGEIVWRPVKENIDRYTKIIESFRG